MKECGCSLSDFVAQDDELQLCKENGLYCIFEGRLGRDELLTLSAAEIDAELKARVEATKDDPNVWGYCLIDEPGAPFQR